MLKIEKLTKSFGEKNVLAEFSAAINDGEKALIIGSSGAGKTTLLRIIAGLEIADSGDITLPGNGVVSVMFQEPRLFPWMNVIDNVTVVLDKNSEDTAIKLLSDLVLEKELYHKPSELSGGMQRRVALARTLLFPADLYLFDEPFAGLDPETALIASEAIMRYTDGKTVLIVSHDRSMLSDSIKTIVVDKQH